MRLIDADKLDMSVKVDGDRTLSPISQLIAQTIIENAQTIESDEDCISRKAVIDAIYANGVWENEYNLTSSRIKKAVESLPPVTPKPKMGRWIDDKCSVCGEDRAWYGQNPPYCPDCGAKMLPTDSEKE